MRMHSAGDKFFRHFMCLTAILRLNWLGNLLVYRRVKLLGVALYYIIYRSHNPNLCRAKDNANHWKVTVLEEFLHTVLLYQAVTVRNINVFSCILIILHRH